MPSSSPTNAAIARCRELFNRLQRQLREAQSWREQDLNALGEQIGRAGRASLDEAFAQLEEALRGGAPQATLDAAVRAVDRHLLQAALTQLAPASAPRASGRGPSNRLSFEQVKPDEQAEQARPIPLDRLASAGRPLPSGARNASARAKLRASSAQLRAATGEAPRRETQGGRRAADAATGEARSTRSTPPTPLHAIPGAIQRRAIARDEDEDRALVIDELTFPIDAGPVSGWRGPSERGLLPESPGLTFEDSGLLMVFVEDTLEGLPLAGGHEELDIEIDVEPVREMSDAERALLALIEHLQRVLTRLLDSLELALGTSADEAADVARQLNRVARVLGLLQLDEHLAMIAYLQARLPLRHPQGRANVLRAVPPRQLDPRRLASFDEAARAEVLNSMVHLIGRLIEDVPNIDRERFERQLGELYEATGLVPALPGGRAPVAGQWSRANVKKPSQQVLDTLVEIVEQRLGEVLSGLTASLLDGAPQGNLLASQHLMQLADELAAAGVSDVLVHLSRLSELLRRQRPVDPRPGRLLRELEALIQTLEMQMPQLHMAAFRQYVHDIHRQFELRQRRRTERLVRLELPGLAEEVDSDQHRWRDFCASVTPGLDALEALLHASPEGRAALTWVERGQAELRGLRDLARGCLLPAFQALFEAMLATWRLETAPTRLPTLRRVIEAVQRMLDAGPPDDERLRRLVQALSSGGQRTAASDAPLNLLRDLEALLEALAHPASAQAPEALIERRGALLGLAYEARRHRLNALGVAVEVIGELLASPAEALLEPEARREALLRACEQALTLMQPALRASVSERGRALARLDDLEAYFVSEELTLIDQLLFDRSWRAHARLAFDAARSVHSEERADRLPVPTALERYRLALDQLDRIAQYTGVHALLPALHAHQASVEGLALGVSSAPGLEADLQRLDQRFTEALPHLALPLYASADVQALTGLVQTTRSWLRRLHHALDEEDARARPGRTSSALLQEMLELLTPAARRAAHLPFIASVCELREVVVELVSGAQASSRERLELALYWMERALQLVELHEHRAQSLGGVWLDALPSLSAELRCRADLVQSGDDGRLHARLKPATLLTSVATRATARAMVLGKEISISVDERWRPDEQSIAPMLALVSAAETLVCGIIDHVLSAAPEHSTHMTLRLLAGVRQLTLIIEHSGRPLETGLLREALIQAGHAPAEDDAADALIEQLCHSPGAHQALPEGVSLALAAAQLRARSGQLELGPPERPRLLLSVPLPGVDARARG